MYSESLSSNHRFAHHLLEVNKITSNLFEGFHVMRNKGCLYLTGNERSIFITGAVEEEDTVLGYPNVYIQGLFYKWNSTGILKMAIISYHNFPR